VQESKLDGGHLDVMSSVAHPKVVHASHYEKWHERQHSASGKVARSEACPQDYQEPWESRCRSAKT